MSIKHFSSTLHRSLFLSWSYLSIRLSTPVLLINVFLFHRNSTISHRINHNHCEFVSILFCDRKYLFFWSSRWNDCLLMDLMRVVCRSKQIFLAWFLCQSWIPMENRSRWKQVELIPSAFSFLTINQLFIHRCLVRMWRRWRIWACSTIILSRWHQKWINRSMSNSNRWMTICRICSFTDSIRRRSTIDHINLSMVHSSCVHPIISLHRTKIHSSSFMSTMSKQLDIDQFSSQSVNWMIVKSSTCALGIDRIQLICVMIDHATSLRTIIFVCISRDVSTWMMTIDGNLMDCEWVLTMKSCKEREEPWCCRLDRWLIQIKRNV